MDSISETVDTWIPVIKNHSSEAIEGAFASADYNSLTDVQKAALAKVLDERNQVHSTIVRSPKFSRLKRIALGAMISAVVLLIGSLLFYFLGNTTNNRTPVPAPNNSLLNQ